MAETDFPPLQRMEQEPLQQMDDHIHHLNTRISREQRRLDLLNRRHRQYLRDFDTINGLGDRERSISPPEDDHWETMLSTITPDTIAPTAESSFTSAAASASFSNGNSNSMSGSATNSTGSHSVHTSITIPDEDEDEELEECEDYNPYTYPPFALDSDDDSSDDSGDDSDASAPATTSHPRALIASAPTPPLRLVAEPHRLSPFSHASSTRPAHLRSPSPGGSRRSPVPRASHPLSQSYSASATVDLPAEAREPAVRPISTGPPSYVSQRLLDEAIEVQRRMGSTTQQHDADVPERRAAVSHRSPELGELESSVAEVERRGQAMSGMMEGLGQRMQELDRMRSVIERMGRREDIPEEWWANVGLGGVGRRGRL